MINKILIDMRLLDTDMLLRIEQMEDCPDDGCDQCRLWSNEHNECITALVEHIY